MAKPKVKTTSFKKHPVYIEQGLHVDGGFYGVKPQYCRAEVIPGGDCETVGDFTEELSGSFDITATGSGKVGSNSITLTQTAAAGGKSVYLLLATPVDLSWAKYVGFWFKGADGDIFAAGDIRFYIFTDKSKYLYADCLKYINLFTGGFTEEATAVWHYAELALSSFTVNSGKDVLSEVWGIGFVSLAGTNGNLIIVDQIEFYTHATGYGSARGRILSAPIKDGVTVALGNVLGWEAGSGRVKIGGNNEPGFAGIAVAAGTGVGNEKGTTFADFVIEGPVNMKASGAIDANEGVCMSAAGTAPTIDDGGAGAQGYEFAKALEAATAAAEVITVLLGAPVTSMPA